MWPWHGPVAGDADIRWRRLAGDATLAQPVAIVGIRTAQPNKRLRQIVRNIFIAVRACREKVSECFDSPPIRLL